VLWQITSATSNLLRNRDPQLQTLPQPRRLTPPRQALLACDGAPSSVWTSIVLSRVGSAPIIIRSTATTYSRTAQLAPRFGPICDVSDAASLVFVQGRDARPQDVTATAGRWRAALLQARERRLPTPDAVSPPPIAVAVAAAARWPRVAARAASCLLLRLAARRDYVPFEVKSRAFLRPTGISALVLLAIFPMTVGENIDLRQRSTSWRPLTNCRFGRLGPLLGMGLAVGPQCDHDLLVPGALIATLRWFLCGAFQFSGSRAKRAPMWMSRACYYGPVYGRASFLPKARHSSS